MTRNASNFLSSSVSLRLSWYPPDVRMNAISMPFQSTFGLQAWRERKDLTDMRGSPHALAISSNPSGLSSLMPRMSRSSFLLRSFMRDFHLLQSHFVDSDSVVLHLSHFHRGTGHCVSYSSSSETIIYTFPLLMK
jgi:hypothetical protein